MLTKLRVKNLKAWGEQLWEEGVELAPITLFLGPNSAGKSSLLQVPLLLKQTFNSPDPNLDLNFGGQPTDVVDWGTIADAIHNYDPELEVGIGVSLTTSDERPTNIDYSAIFRSQDLDVHVEKMSLSFGGCTYAAEKRHGNIYDFDNDVIIPSNIEPGKPKRLSWETFGELAGLPAESRWMPFKFQSEFKRIAYLGPLREAPSRIFGWTGARPGYLGSRGEHVFAALHGRKGSSIAPRVSDWLKRLGIADGLYRRQQGDSRYYELVVDIEGRNVNIMDVGFGISQVLPMLVLAYFVPEGATIIAEQPEIHLHPRAQAGLADLMVEVAKERNVQFVVETHSEHLFRRLQTLIADEKIESDNCRLYFADRDEERSARLTRLEVDHYGRIRNWPDSFFGDAIGEVERQTRLMFKRIKGTKSND